MRDYSTGKVGEPEPLTGVKARAMMKREQKTLRLFPEQEVALKAWGEGWDAVVNDHLRTGAPKDAAAKEVRFLVRELDSLLSHTRTGDQMTAYAALSGRVRPDEGWEALVGRVLDDPGYMGLTLKDGPADTEGDVTVRVLVPEGSRVLALHEIPEVAKGTFEAQPELVAARKTRMRVVAAREVKGRTVLDAVMLP